MRSWKTYFLKIFYYHIYLGEGEIFFNLFNFFYFPRNLIFTFFIFFMERGKVGTLRRLWNQFIKFRLTFPGRKISSLKNLTHFHFFIFLTLNLLNFLDTSQGGDIHHHFYILHLDILISECSQLIIMKQIIYFTKITFIF